MKFRRARRTTRGVFARVRHQRETRSRRVSAYPGVRTRDVYTYISPAAATPLFSFRLLRTFRDPLRLVSQQTRGYPDGTPTPTRASPSASMSAPSAASTASSATSLALSTLRPAPAGYSRVPRDPGGIRALRARRVRRISAGTAAASIARAIPCVAPRRRWWWRTTTCADGASCWGPVCAGKARRRRARSLPEPTTR